MKVLLTGSSGFIGTNVGEWLCRNSHEIVSFDLADGMDVADAERVLEVGRGCDAIVHCAGWVGTHHSFESIGEVVSTNITGTLSVLEAATEFDIPVVVVSLKNDWSNPYMITKQASAKFVRMYHTYRGTKTVLLRAMNVYGPHQGVVKQKIVPDFIVNALLETPLTIYGDGKQIVDMTHVDDLADVILRCLEQQAWGSEMDVGTGVPATVLEVAKALEDILQKPLELHMVPMRIGEPTNSVSLADCSAMKCILDYYPATPWRKGLEQTVDWYVGNLDKIRSLISAV
jgi:nucleoside-diphosphate-sugar epimerase